jgi:two-component system, OmpR family, response regulator ChvI
MVYTCREYKHHHHSPSKDQSDNKDSLDDENIVDNYHHHFIACKDYDKTIKRKIQSAQSVNHLAQVRQQEEQEEEGESEQTQGSNKNNTTRRIMIVEDDSDVNFSIKLVLETEGIFRADSYTDPLVALENYKPGLYDLLLIDIAMPKMNGFELYDKIRKLDNKVKICFITASEMYYEEVRKQLFPELDVNCFIRKPVANEDLIQQVKEILQET